MIRGMQWLESLAFCGRVAVVVTCSGISAFISAAPERASVSDEITNPDVPAIALAAHSQHEEFSPVSGAALPNSLNSGEHSIVLPALLSLVPLTNTAQPIRSATPTPTVLPNRSVRWGPSKPVSPPEPQPPTDVYTNCLVTELTDYWSDEAIDRIRVTEYDNQSAELSEHYDGNADGVVDRVSHTIRGDDGQIVRATVDLENDGELDVVSEYEYSDGMLRAIRTTNRGGDDTIVSYQYDDDWNLIQEIRERGDGDFNVYRVLGYKYDDQNRRILTSISNSIERPPTTLTSYEWEGVLLIAAQSDLGADGVVDLRSVYQYDRYRRLTRVLIDTHADGMVDDIEEYHYDGTGLLVEATYLRGAVVESASVFSYDSVGRLERWITRGHIGGATTVSRSWVCR